MFPVTIALGMINLSLLINSLLGTLVSDQAPAAIDKAFRIYQLPQGLFSISIATILFPTMSKLAARGATDDLRATMANGVRQVALLLIPSAVLMAVLAEPITRLVYQRGEFDAEATELVKTAMVWWSISLPFQGISLLFSRTFFSLQQPWATTALAFANMVVNGLVSLALYKPFGIAGIVIGTVVGTLVMTTAQGWLLRGQLGGIEGAKMLASGVRMLAAAALLAARLLRRLGRASTRCWAGRSRRSWRRWGWASPPAWRCTRAACGRCGCPRRARSGRCCPGGAALAAAAGYGAGGPPRRRADDSRRWTASVRVRARSSAGRVVRTSSPPVPSTRTGRSALGARPAAIGPAPPAAKRRRWSPGSWAARRSNGPRRDRCRAPGRPAA